MCSTSWKWRRKKNSSPVKTKLRYSDADGFRLTHEEENAFIGRTFTKWQDTLRSTLKFSFSNKRWVNAKYLPFLKRTVSSSEGTVWYAEGVGLIQQEFVDGDGVVAAIDLVDVEVVN